MKALNNFYGERKGVNKIAKYYEVGDEVNESSDFMKKLKKLKLIGEDAPNKPKTRKFSTKNGKPNTEDK